VHNTVLKWLFCFQEKFLADARGIYHASGSSKDSTGAEAQRQLDIFVEPNGKNPSKTIHDGKNVDVTDEPRESDKV
jgi:hypothetical protein